MKKKKIPDEIINKIEEMLNLVGPVEIVISKNTLGNINFSFTEKCQLKHD